jgi:O-antigen/teichoic acid export membrane protein
MDVEQPDGELARDDALTAPTRPGQPVTKRALASGATSLTMSQAFQYGVRSATAIILAHFLSPAEFGLLGLVTVVTGLLDRTISDSGLVNALVHRHEVSKRLASSVFYFNVATGLLIALTLALAAAPLASLLGTDSATAVFRGLSVTFALAGLTHVPEAILRRSFRYGALAFLGGANALTAGLVAVPLAIAGYGIASIVIGSIVGITVEVISGFALSRFRPQLHFQLSEVRTLTSYSSNYTAFHFVNYISDAGDKFIVGRFVGQAALGFYTVPYRLVFAPVYAAGQVFKDLFFTVFARKQDEPQAIGRDYIRAVTALAALTFPFAALISALGGPIVAVVLGAQWVPAGPIVSVMSIVVLIQSVLITTGMLLTATGRTRVLLHWGLGAAIVMFVCYGAGVYWGAMGVACGFLVGTLLLMYPAVAIPFRYLGCSVWALVRSLAPVAFATLVGAAFAAAVRVLLESHGSRSIVITIAGLLIGSAAYLLALVLQKPPVIGDVRLFMSTRFRRAPASSATREDVA